MILHILVSIIVIGIAGAVATACAGIAFELNPGGRAGKVFLGFALMTFAALVAWMLWAIWQ